MRHSATDHPSPLSAASKRALHYTKGPEWFLEFRETDLRGDLAYEAGVIRRDPSAVLKIDGVYYVWYTKGEGETAGFGTGDPSAKVFPWDLTEIWYATSADGWEWTEQGLAVGRGPAGSFDDRAVFTPEIFAHDGQILSCLPSREGALCRARQEPGRHGSGRFAPRTVDEATRPHPLAG